MSGWAIAFAITGACFYGGVCFVIGAAWAGVDYPRHRDEHRPGPGGHPLRARDEVQ